MRRTTGPSANPCRGGGRGSRNRTDFSENEPLREVRGPDFLSLIHDEAAAKGEGEWERESEKIIVSTNSPSSIDRDGEATVAAVLRRSLHPHGSTDTHTERRGP